MMERSRDWLHVAVSAHNNFLDNIFSSYLTRSCARRLGEEGLWTPHFVRPIDERKREIDIYILKVHEKNQLGDDQRIKICIGLSRKPLIHCPYQIPFNSPFATSPSNSPFKTWPCSHKSSVFSTPSFPSPLPTNSATAVNRPLKQLGHPIRSLSTSVSRRVSHRSSSTLYPVDLVGQFGLLSEKRNNGILEAGDVGVKGE